ncbi:MAG: GGDEF domain-containing protein [Anaerolineales bacterium]|nr:GGDEF domain-containing protein [Anaerolineales bacterium]
MKKPVDAMTNLILENLNEGVYFVDPDRKITYWNSGAEEITGYENASVVGKFCYQNILQHVSEEGEPLCIEHCPLAKTMLDGIPREANIFLHHSEGSRVPVIVKAIPVFDDEGKIIGAVEIFREDQNKTARDRLKETLQLVYKDDLTGLGNRRFLEKELAVNLEMLREHEHHFAILYMDIDNFKSLNDKYGHLFGDKVLHVVGKTLDDNIRLYDYAVRWGGDEFVIVLRNIDNAPDLNTLAKKLKMLVETSTIRNKEKNLEIAVRVSVGGTLANSIDSINSLIKRADLLMYQAKAKKDQRIMIDWSQE